MRSSLQFLASFIGVAGLSLSVSLPSVAQTSPSRQGVTGSNYQSAVSIPANSQSESIVAIVDESDSFELLNALIRVAAIEDPSIATKLSSGEFTVFAPTDEAFAALPPDAIRALVQPQNRDLLVRILSNHIVPGVVPASEIASIDLGTSIGTGLTPPPGDFSPNDNVANVDTSQSIRPNSDRDMSNAGGLPSSGVQPEGNLTPPPGDFNPNDNVGNVDTSDSIRPNSDQSMSSPGGVGSVAQTEIPGRPEATPGFDTPGDVQRGDSNMNMDSMDSMGSTGNMNMDSRDDNQASEPPSGELRPNENVANVQGETLSPRGDRNSASNSMNMGNSSAMSGTSISAARVIGADIPASNGVIHAINRVILTPELQSELQEAIVNVDSASSPAR
ncbi:fasciclin domain-containing protein [Microcoleus sp. FACHB-1515]|uniref:fasciclin domain-containing protein n=1 Tax=Cyanophyceae TaxID=3028117 RepID=UPI001683510B|nr:fasciclin domain-containing protein [Microcoleus sp. FACHB-1515]MBD2092102.1 fasciclin domain-containing protein [Microcoleus sp. FACHB-1515]